MTIEVSVGEGDSNIDLLQRVARQIMAADSRLEATVRETWGEDANSLPVRQVALEIRSAESGSDMRFTLNDASGDLVERLGLSRVSPAGSNARVLFNDTLYESGDNELTLSDPAVQLNLLATSASGETLAIRSGQEAVYRQALELIDGFNEYVDFLQDHRADIKPVILDDLMAASDERLRDLKSIGILPLGDGRLKGGPAFSRLLAAEPERVGKVLNGDSGFFSVAGDILQGVLDRDTANYGRAIVDQGNTYRGSAVYNRSLSQGLSLSVLA